MHKIRFKGFRAELALGMALVLCMAAVLLPFGRRCAAIRQKVLRLHVVAHSDDAVDQALKLQVRDLVLEQTSPLFLSAASRNDAEAALTPILPELERAAEALLRDAGYPYRVRAQLTEMYFTTRTYDSGTLPAGNYRALRLTIGSGQGRNWWCVMFPPMCLSAAVTGRTPESVPGDVLSAEEQEIVTHPEDYEIRLKIVEWWTQLQSWLEKHRS
ncbi:MAG: stage II sporulation protein R [Clostridia bacterium]|nr:stage II sporulation protein R [Clostridia bacterium]